MDTTQVVLWMIGICCVMLVMIIFARHVKMLGRVLVNSILGIIGLSIGNLLMGYIGIQVGVNMITILIIGFLGFPGFVALYAIQAIL